MKTVLLDILTFSWPIITIILGIVFIIRIAYFRNHKKKFSFQNELMLLIFITYILILFQLVTYKNNEYAGYNLIPFTEILRYKFGSPDFNQQVIGNIILFIPFGYFVTYYANIKKMGSVLLSTVGVCIIIETVQYFIGRSFDVDDILLNTTGAIIGFLLYIGLNAIKKHLPKFLQKDIIYTILTVILIIFIVLYYLGIIAF